MSVTTVPLNILFGTKHPVNRQRRERSAAEIKVPFGWVSLFKAICATFLLTTVSVFFGCSKPTPMEEPLRSELKAALEASGVSVQSIEIDHTLDGPTLAISLAGSSLDLSRDGDGENNPRVHAEQEPQVPRCMFHESPRPEHDSAERV